MPFLGDAQTLAGAVRRFLELPAVKFPGHPALTTRQREVAALLADGLTNRDIANRLGIEERSAEGHIERIRNRLGFRSRSQVAAWWAASRHSGISPPDGDPDLTIMGAMKRGAHVGFAGRACVA